MRKEIIIELVNPMTMRCCDATAHRAREPLDLMSDVSQQSVEFVIATYGNRNQSLVRAIVHSVDGHVSISLCKSILQSELLINHAKSF
jgi:hypothetical protein